MVAVSVYVLDLTGSVWSLTLVSFFRALPMLTFGVLFGAIADRFDRRKLLISVTVLQATVYTVLGMLVVTHRIEIWHVFLGAFLSGVGWATDFPVRRNMVSEVVGISRISSAIGADQATMNISRIVGPTLSGVLVQEVGVQAAYFTSAVLFMVATVLAFSVRWRPQRLAASLASPARNIVDGLRYVRVSDIILPTLVITIVVNVFVFPYTFVVPAIATDDLGVSPLLLGVLSSVEGVGATIGSLLIATRARQGSYTRVYVVGSCVFAAMVIAFSAAPWYVLTLPIVFIAGLGMSGFGGMQSIIILNATPAHMRGRVLGVLTVCIGSGPIGALLIGLLSQEFGARTGVGIMGTLGITSILLTLAIWPRFMKARSITPDVAKVPSPA